MTRAELKNKILAIARKEDGELKGLIEELMLFFKSDNKRIGALESTVTNMTNRYSELKEKYKASQKEVVRLKALLDDNNVAYDA